MSIIDEKLEAMIKYLDSDFPFKELELFYEIEPEPYSRPRKRRGGGMYNPRSKYKNKLIKLLKEDIKQSLGDFEVIEGEIHLFLEFGLEAPKKVKETKSRWFLAVERLLRPITRPDIDNFCKPILDCLNKFIYKDDGQITVLHAEKVFTETVPYIKIILVYREKEIKFKRGMV